MTTQDFYLTLRTAVLDTLRSRDVTQHALADMAGMSVKHVNQMLTGRVCGSLDAWDTLFAALGMQLALHVTATDTVDGRRVYS